MTNQTRPSATQHKQRAAAVELLAEGATVAPKRRKGPRARDPNGRATSILTPAIQKTIVAAVRRGSFQSDAAHLAGVAPSTLERWCAEGRAEPDGVYGPIALAVNCARAAFRDEQGRKLLASSDLANTRWLLARLDPLHYEEKIRTTLDAEQREFLQALKAVATPEEWAKVLDLYRAAKARAASGLPMVALDAERGT